MRHVFGPVPSRRLGRSLGIDVVPFKTCTYDCIYCQLGRTTDRTVERKEYAPLDDILCELDARLAAGPPPDYVTLSGSGEPTLYSRLAPLIAGIRKRTDRPIAVLTNGSLLWHRDVQESLLEADLVIPSLDAGDEATFQQVNRPHPELSLMRVVGGIEEFCRRSRKPVWLEVFLLEALNTTGGRLENVVRLVDRIKPDRVQLNTVTRPSTEEFARPVPADDLIQAASLFGDQVEVITEYDTTQHSEYSKARREDILNLLKRRPCTMDDVAAGLGLHPNEVAKHLEDLVRERVLVSERKGTRVFHRFAEQTDDDSAPRRQSGLNRDSTHSAGS